MGISQASSDLLQSLSRYASQECTVRCAFNSFMWCWSVYVQSLFDAIPSEEIAGSTLVLGGDGRYFNKEAAQVLVSSRTE